MNDRELPVAPSESPLDTSPRSARKSTRGQSRIEFERLSQFFHVPINEAAKGLGVCATVLKKVCRKHGIPRWPHRKIKKIDTMLAMLEISAGRTSTDPRHEEEVRKKMEVLIQERTKLMTEGKTMEVERKVSGSGSSKRKKREDEDVAMSAPVLVPASIALPTTVPPMMHEFTMLNKQVVPPSMTPYPEDLGRFSMINDLPSKHMRFTADDSMLSPVMFSLSNAPSHMYPHFHHHDLMLHHHPEHQEGHFRLLGVDIPMQE